IKLVRRKLESFRIIHRSSRLHAKQNLMRTTVSSGDIMAVVGRNQRNIEVLLQFKKIVLNPLLFFQSLILNLKIEVAAPEDIFILLGHAASLGVIVSHQVIAK